MNNKMWSQFLECDGGCGSKIELTSPDKRAVHDGVLNRSEMKIFRILAVVLALSVAAVPQTLEEKLKHLDTLADHMNRDLARLAKQKKLRDQVEEEYSAMTKELVALHDPTIAGVILPHLEKITKYRERIDAIAKESAKDK